VSNVLINAVEACRDGGSVIARADRVREGGSNSVVVTISDTGCGMSGDHLARIWEPYVTGKAGGTGLGLSIVRQTISAHGGCVAASSVPREGTSIRITLPAHAGGELLPG
nr:hypothetical protein [Gemmatimonadaceae bacterium]